MEPIAIISIFVLAVFVCFEVVSKVSSTLHTPLMSGANAIHGVILVGAIIVTSHSKTNLELGLSVAAMGGFAAGGGQDAGCEGRGSLLPVDS